MFFNSIKNISRWLNENKKMGSTHFLWNLSCVWLLLLKGSGSEVRLKQCVSLWQNYNSNSFNISYNFLKKNSIVKRKKKMSLTNFLWIFGSVWPPVLKASENGESAKIFTLVSRFFKTEITEITDFLCLKKKKSFKITTAQKIK